MKFKIHIIVIIVLLFQSSSIFAQDSWNISKIGSIYDFWEAGSDFVIKDNYAYIATGESGLKIMDLSDPEVLEIVNTINLGDVGYLAISGDYLYLTAEDSNEGEEGEFKIYDITDSLNPELVGSCTIDENVISIILTSEKAYLGGRCDTRMIDISDPQSPYVSAIDLPTRHTIGAYGSYLYSFNHSQSQIEIVDFSDPESPEIVGSVPSEFIVDMEVSGTFLYVTGNDPDFNLGIFDISSPESPTIVGDYNCQNGFGRKIKIIDDKLYLTIIDEDYNNLGSEVIDISNPSNPNMITSYEDIQFVHGITANENYLYTFVDRQVTTYDVSNPDSQMISDSYDGSWVIYDLEVSGDYAFVSIGSAHNGNSIRVVDISNISEPQEVSQLDGWYFKKCISEELLYATRSDTVLIIDVSNPLDLNIISEFSVDVEWAEYGIDIVEMQIIANTLFISFDFSDPGSNGHFGIMSVDVSAPNNPEVVGMNISNGGENSAIRDCEIYNDMLFRTSHYSSSHGGQWGEKLGIYEISDILSPESLCTLSGHSDQGSPYRHYNLVDVNNEFMFTATDSLAIYDISNVAEPTMINQVSVQGWATSMEYSESHIYLSKDGSFEIYNIDDSSAITRAGLYETPSNISDFVIIDEFVITISPYTLSILDCYNALNVSENNDSEFPTEFAIMNTYPNPFNPTLNVSISMPQSSDLKVSVFNIMGQEVATLSSGGQYSAGVHNFIFNANEVTSHSSGVYFVHASVPGKLNQVKKVVLMK
jgi:hypothetical protein